jgi:hypothetical protein
MEAKDYHYLRLIGAVDELQHFCHDHVCDTEFGIKVFVSNPFEMGLKPLDIPIHWYGEVEQFFSTSGQLILIEIYAEINNADHKLINRLQKKFTNLKFHSVVYIDYDMQEFHSFTRLINGEISFGADELPMIDESIFDPDTETRWYVNYKSNYLLRQLAKNLDKNIVNLRYVKLKRIFGIDPTTS